MRNSGRRLGGVKHLTFGTGDKADYLFAAALGAIIVLATVLTIRAAWGGGDGEEGGDGKPHFECQKCKHQFTIDPRDMSRGSETEEGDLGGRQIDCPKCGAKASCLRMTRCPNPDCGKYYVPDAYRQIAESAAEGQERSFKSVCPHCGTDRDEWYREYYKTRKP